MNSGMSDNFWVGATRVRPPTFCRRDYGITRPRPRASWPGITSFRRDVYGRGTPLVGRSLPPRFGAALPRRPSRATRQITISSKRQTTVVNQRRPKTSIVQWTTHKVCNASVFRLMREYDKTILEYQTVAVRKQWKCGKVLSRVQCLFSNWIPTVPTTRGDFASNRWSGFTMTVG